MPSLDSTWVFWFVGWYNTDFGVFDLRGCLICVGFGFDLDLGSVWLKISGFSVCCVLLYGLRNG